CPALCGVWQSDESRGCSKQTIIMGCESDQLLALGVPAASRPVQPLGPPTTSVGRQAVSAGQVSAPSWTRRNVQPEDKSVSKPETSSEQARERARNTGESLFRPC